MHSGKKITKEDTWKPADLRRHIREEGYSDDYYKKQDSNERKHHSGDSRDKQRTDPEKESRRERDKHKEQESARERAAEDKKDKYAERRKEGSRDRRGNREKDRTDERDSEKRSERERQVDETKYSDVYGEKRERRRDKERLVEEDKYSEDYRKNRDRRRDREHPVHENKYSDDYRENRESRRDREEKHNRDRDKERHRVKEKERVRDRERYNDEEREKRREERDKEKRREERDREHRTEKRRHEESREGGKNWIETSDRDQRDQRHRERDRHKGEYEEKTNEKERHKRHGDRKHIERKEQREYKEPRTHKEERERQQKERENHDEKWKRDSESMKKQDLKVSVEEVRHHHGDRERVEWDEYKDKWHRNGNDVEKKHRERRHREGEDPENQQTETEVVIDEDLGEDEYENDFEDYEEDFEEIDESAEEEDEDEKETQPLQVGEEREELTLQRKKEIEAIQRAMDEENERVETAQPRQSTSREEEDGSKWSRTSETKQSRGSQRGKFINFVAAKQHEVSKKVATKQKKRSTELLRLIDLDFSPTFSLLDLPPVNEYEMYIRNFGSANTKQAYVQCNEDNTDRDIQTEEIELCEKWTQHPPENSGACGDPKLSQEAHNKTISELNFDLKRLTEFLSSASQVMVVLLEEDQAERNSLMELRTQKDTLSFSEGSLQLNTKLPFLYGRHISLVHFSQVQRHTMMSVHMPTTKPGTGHLDRCSIICIWNIWEPSSPQKILVYESEVQCCCFSPGKATLVFAGTSVGSVVLWDLREPSSNHYRQKIGEDEWTFRQPSFSTDAVMAHSGHFSSVTSVEVVPSGVAGGLGPGVPLLESEEGLSFQLASLDESGVLNFWVVVELPKGNEAGSPTDLGLRPGSKVKLLHSSSLLTVNSVSPRDAVKLGPLQTLHLKFLPTDPNHFFVGTNMGLVNHGTSHGLKAAPNFYRFREPGVRPVDVSSIHFSPFRQNMFLVGCGDGSIRLHALSHEQPVAECKSSTAGEPVVSLQWAQTRPTVFCVLDAASNLHIWDLLKNETEPVVTETMNADRVTAMAVFGDPGQQNIYSGVALAHESGKIEMQYFTRNFTLPISEEEEKLETQGPTGKQPPAKREFCR
ncbi:hypothetical protein Q5P01_004190 [Channa striata]|uniref:WD repeat domain 60 n=1 Tax=Channa striata TaxID=64152 RepID=A0AA88NN69_CHASR|nr:hypothetical protein Q5P01_004190 [Channa striata]